MTTLSSEYLRTGLVISATGEEAEIALGRRQSIDLPQNRVTILAEGVKRRVLQAAELVQAGLSSVVEGEIALIAPTFELHKRTPIKRLETYLRDLRGSGALSDVASSNAWKVWNKLRQVTGYSLPVPNAAPGEDDYIMYVWRHCEHYLELELAPTGMGEFFYRNRVSGELWEWDYRVGDEVPTEVQDKLRIFI